MGEGSLHRPRLANPNTRRARKSGPKNFTNVIRVNPAGWLGWFKLGGRRIRASPRPTPAPLLIGEATVLWVSILPENGVPVPVLYTRENGWSYVVYCLPNGGFRAAFGPTGKPREVDHIREFFRSADDAKERLEVIAEGFRNQSARMQARGIAAAAHDQNESSTSFTDENAMGEWGEISFQWKGRYMFENLP